MTTNIYRFQPIEHRERRTGRCPVCNRVVVRWRTFSQTQNPYNRNEDGTVKSVPDILKEIRAEGAKWVPDFTHEKCREGGAS